jgi:hypothetical protein
MIFAGACDQEIVLARVAVSSGEIVIEDAALEIGGGRHLLETVVPLGQALDALGLKLGQQSPAD